MKSLIEEQKVREFLLNEKDFFLRNEDLLCLLKLSHPNTRGSVSLLEKQNKLLRKSLEENRKELGSLKENATRNHEPSSNSVPRMSRVCTKFGGFLSDYRPI